MRIISEHKDYYDKVKNLDDDHTLLYIRSIIQEQLIYPDIHFHYFDFFDFFINNFTAYAKQNAIGFCGELYPFITLTMTDNNFNKIKKIFYNSKEFEEFISSSDNKLKYKKKNEYYLKRYRNCKIFEKFKNNKSFKNYFQYKDKEIPLFSIVPIGKRDIIITYNCLLKDYEFYRVYDAYVTYTKLESYLNNIARPLKEIPKISDETMLEIKGFDKFSFRKAKSE